MRNKVALLSRFLKVLFLGVVLGTLFVNIGTTQEGVSKQINKEENNLRMITFFYTKRSLHKDQVFFSFPHFKSYLQV